MMLTLSDFLSRLLAYFFAFQSLQSLAADPVQVTVPSQPAPVSVVHSNFLGISFELSSMSQYFGNDTSTIPQPILNYLRNVRSRIYDRKLRLRVGGSSIDYSTYIPSQTSPMVELMDSQANPSNQTINYGPILWNVLKKVAQEVDGAKYLIGLSLLNPDNPNIPLLAGAAENVLQENLDAFLLGNEPDLYTDHHKRPNLQNYTKDNYINEFAIAMMHLANTSAGNLLKLANLGGPTICCSWDLAVLLKGGYQSKFNKLLKYITLQHYPQDNCFGSYRYELSYYLKHAEVVKLASWQKTGISVVLSNISESRHSRLLMTEFNSASCGGIPGISDTFAVGSIWTIDYSLQLASVGYSAAYIHTREKDLSHNLFTPPVPGNGTSWITNPPYYALLVLAEIVNSKNGSFVVDLDTADSKIDKNATVSAYAIYDVVDSSVLRLVLFNYANTTTQFSLASNSFAKSPRKGSLILKFLSASSFNERTNISWGGQTLAGVGNGQLIAAPPNISWAPANQRLDCSNGCIVSVPGPGIGVVMITEPQPTPGFERKNDASRSGVTILLVVIVLTMSLLCR